MSAPTWESSALLFGLAAAASWGAGDFSGGWSAKVTPVHRVILLSQLTGALLLLAVTMVVHEPPAGMRNLIIGAVAGLAGTFGLMLLYSGLARQPMGIVAPLTAVTAAVLPVGFGMLSQGLPTIVQMAGFCAGLLAVWCLSRSGESHTFPGWGILQLPVASGLCFGIFYILIAHVSTEAVFGPLIAARVASVGVFGAWFLLRRQKIRFVGKGNAAIILADIFDVLGNFFFAMATRTGRIDISAVLSSLYPLSTVMLAWLILGERLRRGQWLGVAAACLALVLFAVKR